MSEHLLLLGDNFDMYHFIWFLLQPKGLGTCIISTYGRETQGSEKSS